MTGKQVSHFRVGEKLGAGGMGVVYEAEDLELGRRVALKFLPPHLSADDEAVRRFVLEAQSASALEHPNVCTIYEIGRTGEGRQFIAMALYDGETLADRLERGPIPVDEAVAIARQVADGLESAHEKGIVHRDIKPANLFLTRKGRPVILDFGLAKLSDRTTMTQMGSTLGTFAYMSPEQARGETVDARSDVWSLGAVLYEMLTGSRPFAGGYEQAVVYAILNEDPAGMEAIPDELRPVVEKALAKEPAERYASAADFAADLAGPVVEARPPSSIGTPAPVASGRKYLVPGVALALAVVVALLSWLAARGPSGPVTLAVMPLSGVGLEDGDWLTEGMTEALITDLAGVSSVRVIQRQSVMRLAALGGTMAGADRQLDVDYMVEGSLTSSGRGLVASIRLLDSSSGEYTWGEEYRGDLDQLSSLQARIAQGIIDALQVNISTSEALRVARERPVDPRAQETYMRGMYFLNRFTPENFARGLELMNEAVALDPEHPLPYAALGSAYTLMGHGNAIPHETFPRAKDAVFKALDLDPNLPEAIGALAEIQMYYDWDWEGAGESFRKALSLNPSLAPIHAHYAWYLSLFGRADEGIEHMATARSLDPLNPLYATWYGWYLMWFDPARIGAEVDRALELAPDFPWALHVKVLSETLQGQNEEAVATSRHLAEIFPDLTWSYGIALARAGRREEALVVVDSLEAHPVGKNIWGLPAIHVALGNTDRALDWIEYAYDYRLDWLPWAKATPLLEPLWGEPRFIAVMDRLRLRVGGPVT